MSEFISTCELAAKAGGAVLQEWIGRFAVREKKGPSDLVTEADLASQEAIRNLVLAQFPDHAFVGEEDPRFDPAEENENYRWIVDPLDGTTNYVHGVPHYAVSVALERNGELLAGCVYDPVLEESYTAGAGEGAFLNGRPIRVSEARALREALVAASFPHQVDPNLHAIREFVAALPACQALRRGGSAALNLAYVAAGRFDAYWATDLHAWDAAAGALLIREAGGVVTNPEGGEFDVWAPRLLVAATAEVHRELRALLAGAR
jgi:myo-inositol-1(or 4)-monophosphatase